MIGNRNRVIWRGVSIRIYRPHQWWPDWLHSGESTALKLLTSKGNCDDWSGIICTWCTCCASSALMSMIIDLVWRIWDLGCWILDSLTLLFKLSFDGKSAKCEVHLSQIRHSVGFALISISLSIANQARNCKHALWTFIHSNFLAPYTVEIYPHWQYPHQRNVGGNYHNQWRNWQKQNCWSQERGKLLSWRRVVSQFNTSPSRWIFIFSDWCW